MTDSLTGLIRFWESASSIEITLWIVCIFLLLFSRIIFSKVFRLSLDNDENLQKLRIFRSTAFLVIVVLLLNHFIFTDLEKGTAKRLLGFVMIAFSAYWATLILQFITRRKFGIAREIGGEKIYVESYNSRFLSILVAIFIFVFALIGTVQLLGFDSLLEAGGLIGVIGVILALTQAAWAPDIISGLIILNSNFLEEGDVVQLDNGTLTARVYRTRLFHTELLNLVNNSRVQIKNARLRESAIHNLSKFASVKGYRQDLSFNIGYDAQAKDVKAMFLQAYDAVLKDESIPVESSHELEIRVGNTDDYAVQWSIYYYTKDMKSVIKTRQLFLEKVLLTAIEHGISLATPDLYQRVGEADKSFVTPAI